MFVFVCSKLLTMAATLLDSGRTSLSTYNSCSTDHQSPPPPIPARLHHPRQPSRPATALGHPGDVDPGNGYLAPVTSRRALQGGPPLPPRQPLRRSVSLTQRAAPQPVPVVGGLEAHTPHEPTLDEVLASLRRARLDTPNPAPLSPALSAPLLGQVFNSSSS